MYILATRKSKRMIYRLGQLINVAFRPKYLFYTNITLSSGIAAVGDLLEQNYEILTKEQETWDGKRTFRMSVAGTTVGVFSHYWYMFLDRKIPQQYVRAVLKKIVLDQVIGSPICIATLLVTVNLMEKANIDQFKDDVKTKSWRLFFAECFFWSPAQFINFYYVPLKFRLLYDNLLSVAYDIFTSYIMNDMPEDKQKRALKEGSVKEL